MITLGLNTVESATSITILKNESYLGSISVNEKRKTASRLIPYVDYLLEQFDISLQDIDLISICAGPGSYTSLRIGYATAKTLCIVNDIKFTEVSRFNIMTETYLDCNARLYKESNTLNISAILPTTYKKVLTQSFTYKIESDMNNSSTLTKLQDSSKPKILDIKEIIKKSSGSIHSLIIGQIKGHRKQSDFLEITNSDKYYEYKDYGSASYFVAKIGLKMMNEGKMSNPFKAEPLYLQSPF